MLTSTTPFTIAQELADRFDRGDNLVSVASLLGRAIRCDMVARVDLDLSRARTVVVTDVGDTDLSQRLADRIMMTSGSHPVVCSYLEERRGLKPRRVSDVCADQLWLASDAYRDGFADLPAPRQLSIMVSLTTPPRGVGWLFFRSGSDFADADLTMARELQAALVLAERVWVKAAMPQPAECEPFCAPAPSSLLTPRERQVMAALATGSSTRLVARALCVSERTVRKHVENAYRKLESHERVGAITTAREQGLI